MPSALGLSTRLTHAAVSRLHSITHIFSTTPIRAFTTTQLTMSGTQGLIAEAFSAAVHRPAARPSPDKYDAKPHHLPNNKGFQNPWDRSFPSIPPSPSFR